MPCVPAQSRYMTAALARQPTEACLLSECSASLLSSLPLHATCRWETLHFLPWSVILSSLQPFSRAPPCVPAAMANAPDSALAQFAALWAQLDDSAKQSLLGGLATQATPAGPPTPAEPPAASASCPLEPAPASTVGDTGPEVQPAQPAPALLTPQQGQELHLGSTRSLGGLCAAASAHPCTREQPRSRPQSLCRRPLAAKVALLP